VEGLRGRGGHPSIPQDRQFADESFGARPLRVSGH